MLFLVKLNYKFVIFGNKLVYWLLGYNVCFLLYNKVNFVIFIIFNFKRK